MVSRICSRKMKFQLMFVEFVRFCICTGTLLLNQKRDWLYEDGDDESADVYAERLQDLKKLVDPIEYWFNEEEARPQAAKNLFQTIRECQTAARSLPASERETVLSELNVLIMSNGW
ncbi:heat shock 70 kDa protein 16 [Spinacia oleracea]|uniref:Heat shock 70 kDa protein 16 n=1 Tax=Spinacia oleracea TaxID=3562 RepID=A0ABM3R1P5_SPIOL|nr:heat shock 70 kDa protein 16-like [Spinacia oleracea]